MPHDARHDRNDILAPQRAAASAWLRERAGLKVSHEDLNGNEFRGMTLLDVARHFAQMHTREQLRGAHPMEIVRRAISHSTSDFSLVLENVAHKQLQATFKDESATYRSFCAIGRVEDFRPHNRYRMGGFGRLEEVKERDQYKYGTISDAERESIQAKTKGKLLSISRQTIINDDLGALLGSAQEMARAAARTVELDAFELLASNPVLSDSIALFHASHANLNTSGAAPTVAGFDVVRQAMAKQKDVGGNDFTNVRPGVWLGPMEYGGAARVVNDSRYDTDAEGVEVPNKSRGLFKQIVDTPRLTGNQWYAFADPEQDPVIEVAFLQGQEDPHLESQELFEVDGIVWKVRHDYGVAAVGYRGAQRVTW